MQSAAAGDIEFSFSSSDAAGIALCTAMHAKVLAAQVEFLKQQILSFQNAHGRRREEPMRLSIDRKPPQLKILGRIASDYEAALASVFDHRDVISMPAAMHTFMVLMCKARTSEERSLCALILRERCTEPCLEEFAVVGGMRLLRLWTRDYENDKDIQALANIAKVCCKIPFNARTKASITESGIPKNIKKLSKTDSKDDALRCMRLWGEGNKNIMAGAAVVAESSPAVQPAPLALFEAARDFISEKRNKYITNRRAEFERFEREKQEEKDRRRAQRALERLAPPSPAPVSSRGVSLDALKKPITPISSSATLLISMNASVPPISTTTGGEDGRKTADILSATRRVVSARHGISLREKAAELLKIQAPKSILKRAIDKETTFNAADTALSAIGLIGGEPPTKKMRRTGLSWVDDVKGTALHSVVEFPLDPGQTIRSTCADDKARRSQIAAIRRRPAAQLLEYQGKFFFENRMNQFKVKTNIFKWSLSPADFQKLAEKRGIDASTCEKKYVTSEELEIQNARMKYAEEAIYIEQGMIPQDPHPFKDKKERIVYTSHTNAKSRAIINIEDCGAESSSASSIIETMIYPADIAAGANDRMTYEFVEEKRPTKVMTYHVNDADYVDMDDVTPSVDGNSSVVVEQGVSLPSEEDITAGEVDLDGISVAVGAGLADSEENQSDIDLDEVDAKGLVALHNLGPEVLNFLINNEDKFNELCIDGVIDEEKTGVLTETVAEFREATNCGDKVFDDIDLNMIFDLAQRKLHRKIESDNFSSSNMEIRSRNAAVDDLKVKILKLIKSKRSIALSQLVLYYKDMYGERFDYPGKLQVFLKSLLEGCQEVSFFGTQIIYTKNSRRNSVENWKNSSSSNVISGGRYNCGASPADSIRNRNPEIQAEKKKDFISSANNNAVCKYYNHNGGCQFGMNCRYLHIS